MSENTEIIRYPSLEYMQKTIKYLNRNFNEGNFKYLRSNTKLHEQDAYKWYENQKNGTQIMFILVNESGDVIGSAHLNRDCGRHCHTAMLSVTIDRNYWNKGYGTKLCEKLIEEGKKKGVKRIEDFPMCVNKAAIRLLEKLGFEKEGILRKRARLDDGTPVDNICMGLCLE